LSTLKAIRVETFINIPVQTYQTWPFPCFTPFPLDNYGMSEYGKRLIYLNEAAVPSPFQVHRHNTAILGVGWLRNFAAFH